MKRNKITAVILSIVMSMSLMIPSVEVLADETSVPSETQKTETVETEESKATETQTPKETEKEEPKETEKSEAKETEKQEPAESDETQITETAGSDKKAPAESKDNGDYQRPRMRPVRLPRSLLPEHFRLHGILVRQLLRDPQRC